MIATALGLPRGQVHGPSDVLASLVIAIRLGKGGSKKLKNLQATGMDALDLKTRTMVAVSLCRSRDGRSHSPGEN